MDLIVSSHFSPHNLRLKSIIAVSKGWPSRPRLAKAGLRVKVRVWVSVRFGFRVRVRARVGFRVV